MARIKKFFHPVLSTYNNDLSKRWRVEYWIPSTDHTPDKRVCVYGNINQFQTIKERIEAAHIIINDLPFKSKTKIDFIEKALLDTAFHLKSKTVKSYRTVANTVRKFIKPISIEHLTFTQWENYLLHLKNVGLNNTTIYNRQLVMNSLFNKAIEKGYTQYNPIVKIKKIKKKSQSLMYFSDDQIKRFKDYVIHHQMMQLWLGVQLLFYCFIRPGEMREMRIGWINFDYGFIEIPAVYSKNGKTQKVSVPNHFLEYIKPLSEFPNNYYVLSKSHAPGPEQVGTNWLNRYNRIVLDAVKIRGRYAFYSWKHTGAVKAVKAGINIKDLQLQLRHHSLDMVNEYLKDLGVMDSEDIRLIRK